MAPGPHAATAGNKSIRAKFPTRKFFETLYRINVEGDLSPEDRDEAQTILASFYDRLTEGSSAERMWNWGYDDPALAALVAPFTRPASDGYSEQLYAKACAPAIAGAGARNILDIGCGAGIGTAFLARANPQCHFTGIDISPAAIELANIYRQNAAATNMGFAVASSDRMEAVAAKIDCAISVESMHNYSSLDAFIDSAARVLMPGATLSIVDFFTPLRRSRFEALASARPDFVLIANDDISAGVKQAIQKRVESIRTTSAARRTSSGRSRLSAYFMDRGMEIMLGSQFLGNKADAVSRIVSMLNAGRVMTIESYRHVVLRRT